MEQLIDLETGVLIDRRATPNNRVVQPLPVVFTQDTSFSYLVRCAPIEANGTSEVYVDLGQSGAPSTLGAAFGSGGGGGYYVEFDAIYKYIDLVPKFGVSNDFLFVYDAPMMQCRFYVGTNLKATLDMTGSVFSLDTLSLAGAAFVANTNGYGTKALYSEFVLTNDILDKWSGVIDLKDIITMNRLGNYIPERRHAYVLEHLTCQEKTGNVLYSCVKQYNYAKDTPGNRIVNGSFNTGDNWTIQNEGWSISGGMVTASGGPMYGSIYQNINTPPLKSGFKYKAIIDVEIFSGQYAVHHDHYGNGITLLNGVNEYILETYSNTASILKFYNNSGSGAAMNIHSVELHPLNVTLQNTHAELIGYGVDTSEKVPNWDFTADDFTGWVSYGGSATLSRSTTIFPNGGMHIEQASGDKVIARSLGNLRAGDVYEVRAKVSTERTGIARVGTDPVYGGDVTILEGSFTANGSGDVYAKFRVDAGYLMNLILLFGIDWDFVSVKQVELDPSNALSRRDIYTKKFKRFSGVHTYAAGNATTDDTGVMYMSENNAFNATNNTLIEGEATISIDQSQIGSAYNLFALLSSANGVIWNGSSNLWYLAFQFSGSLFNLYFAYRDAAGYDRRFTSNSLSVAHYRSRKTTYGFRFTAYNQVEFLVNGISIGVASGEIYGTYNGVQNLAQNSKIRIGSLWSKEATANNDQLILNAYWFAAKLAINGVSVLDTDFELMGSTALKNNAPNGEPIKPDGYAGRPITDSSFYRDKTGLPEIKNALKVTGQDSSGQFTETEFVVTNTQAITLFSAFHYNAADYVGRSREFSVFSLGNKVPERYLGPGLTYRIMSGGNGNFDIAGAGEINLSNKHTSGINTIFFTLENGKGNDSGKCLIRVIQDGRVVTTEKGFPNFDLSNIGHFRTSQHYWYAYFFTGFEIASGVVSRVLDLREMLQIHKNTLLGNPQDLQDWYFFHNRNTILDVSGVSKLPDLTGNNKQAIVYNFTANELNPAHADYAVEPLNRLRIEPVIIPKEFTANIRFNGVSITKTSGAFDWNGGATYDRFVNSGDAVLEIPIEKLTNDVVTAEALYRMIGFATTSALSTNIDGIEFCFYQIGNGFFIRLGGNNIDTGLTLVAGDKVYLKIESGVCKAYKNGTPAYTFATAVTTPLYIKTVMYTVPSTNRNLKLTGTDIKKLT